MRRLLLPLLLLGPLAQAQDVYRWVDSKGGVHYTNNPGTVPQGKKAKVTQGTPLSEMGPPGPPRSDDSAPVETQTQRAGEGEAYWRDQFAQAHQRIRDLQASLAEDRAKVEDPSGLPVLGPYGCIAGGSEVPTDPRQCRLYGVNPDTQIIKDRLVRTEAELARARTYLDELERRASQESVPREWRR